MVLNALGNRMGSLVLKSDGACSRCHGGSAFALLMNSVAVSLEDDPIGYSPGM